MNVILKDKIFAGLKKKRDLNTKNMKGEFKAGRWEEYKGEKITLSVLADFQGKADRKLVKDSREGWNYRVFHWIDSKGEVVALEIRFGDNRENVKEILEEAKTEEVYI